MEQCVAVSSVNSDWFKYNSSMIKSLRGSGKSGCLKPPLDVHIFPTHQKISNIYVSLYRKRKRLLKTYKKYNGMFLYLEPLKFLIFKDYQITVSYCKISPVKFIILYIFKPSKFYEFMNQRFLGLSRFRRVLDITDYNLYNECYFHNNHNTTINIGGSNVIFDKNRLCYRRVMPTEFSNGFTYYTTNDMCKLLNALNSIDSQLNDWRKKIIIKF